MSYNTDTPCDCYFCGSQLCPRCKHKMAIHGKEECLYINCTCKVVTKVKVEEKEAAIVQE